MEPPNTQAAWRWLLALRISALAAMLPILLVARVGLTYLQQAAWTGGLLLALMVPGSVIPYLLILWRFRANSLRKSGVVVALGVTLVWYLVGFAATFDFLVDPGVRRSAVGLWMIVSYWVAIMAPHTALLVSVIKTNRLLGPPLGDKRIFVLDICVAFGCFAAFTVLLTLLTLSI